MPRVAKPKSELGRRIRLARESKGLTQQEMGDLIGVSRSTVSYYEVGSIAPPVDILQKIIYALGLPSSFFFEQTESLPAMHTSPKKLPFFGKIPASKWADRSPRESLTYFDYEPIIKKADFSLEVEGDSMMPNIYPGDIVLVQHTLDVPEGRVAVVQNEHNEVTLKRVVRIRGILTLKPDNPKYPPLDFTEARIIGVVVALIRIDV